MTGGFWYVYGSFLQGMKYNTQFFCGLFQQAIPGMPVMNQLVIGKMVVSLDDTLAV